MTKELTRWVLPIIVAILGILALVGPVAASVPQPTVLEIQSITAYQNAREEGDQLYLIMYEITGNYTQNADQLFIFRLRDNDEVLATATPFPYHDRGYGLGVVAFYLSPDDAPTWEGNVSVQVIGNPLADWDGSLPGTTLDDITWNTGTTADIQNLIAAKIIYLATILGQDWDAELVGSAQGMVSLTSAGASYFLMGVPYATDMVPFVFGQYIFTPDYPIDEKPASDSYADDLIDAVKGTVFDLRSTAREWGISRGALATALWYTFVVGFFIFLIQKRRLNRGTVLLFWPFVIAGAFFGVPLMVTVMASFFSLISTVWVFYKGTT